MIPHVGLTSIRLYPPADRLYKRLWDSREIGRLQGLRQLGALSHALPGARHTRWDYTAALAYYAQSLDVPGMKSSFTLGGVSFSSALAALQTIALCWNIGHLPGTFAVEKGVYRFLYERNPQNPADGLSWPGGGPTYEHLRKEANRFLKEQDYLGMARVLAVIKLLSLDYGTDKDLSPLVEQYVAPVLLSCDDDGSKQWHKLRTAFNIVRHLAYLTLDTVLAGLQWCPPVPALLRQQLDRGDITLTEISDSICEILSPIERMTYGALYHREEARMEVAVIANWVHESLTESVDPQARISGWLRKSLFRDLRIGRKPSLHEAFLGGTVRFRTHFLGPQESPAALEFSLVRKKFPLPLVLTYKAWNSETLIEPDELIIDGITRYVATPDDVGRLLVWMIDHCETPAAKPGNTFELLRKADSEKAYFSLIRRAFELAFPRMSISLEPWPLARFGAFPEMPPEGARGSIWATNATLDDPISKHLLRNRAQSVPASLRDRYAELLGVRDLRNHLRKQSISKRSRQHCLFVTASVRIQDAGRDVIEFDGGIIVIASRSGHMRWYGLESKRGDGDPLHSLGTRLGQIGMHGSTQKLSARYAFVAVDLGKPPQYLRCSAEREDAP